MPRLPARLAARLALALLACWTGTALAEVSLEQRVKAAFLFNFAKFTTWPGDKLAGADSTIQFCVLDGDAIAPALEEALFGKSIDQHPLVLRRLTKPDQFRGCHVAYLGAVVPERLPTLLSAIGGAGVLAVYEADGTQRDGVVRFYLEDNKVRFEINEAAAQRERLQLSSRLLGIASVVHD
jgi:uncharacterized protein DUF4154